MKTLKIQILVLFLIILISCNNSKQITIGITTIVEQPALVDARKGFEDELRKLGYDDKNVTIIYECAQKNAQKAQQISVKFIDLNVNLIYAISTPSALSAAEKTTRIPIVFGAVTDPVNAKLVSSWDKPGGNITGVSDLLDPIAQLNFFKLIIPNVKNVGIVFDPGEPSASITVKSIKEHAKEFGISIVEAPANSSMNVRSAALSLKGKVDCIYIVPDNTVGAALDVMSEVSSLTKIPLLSCETGALESGVAVAALSFNYYKIGQVAAHIADEILKGKAPSIIPVRKIEEAPGIIVSRKNAKSIGFKIPEIAIKNAVKVID
jgi:putative ABC transport system substrate-binding protein